MIFILALVHMSAFGIFAIIFAYCIMHVKKNRHYESHKVQVFDVSLFIQMFSKDIIVLHLCPQVVV